MNRKIVWEHLHAEEDQLDKESQLDDEGYHESDPEMEHMKMLYNMGEPQQLVQTPMGLFHVNDILNPMKQFVWWIGHTNFNISTNVADVLSKTTGVEWVRVVSRYRFLIAVGKAFDFSAVRTNIEENLNILSSSEEDEVDLINKLKQNYEKWAIFYYHDDTFDVIVDDDYSDQIERFIELEKNGKGKLLTYNDI